MRERRFKRWVCSVIVLTMTGLIGSPALAADTAETKGPIGAIHLKAVSVLLPGAGQAHGGHYTKAALFAGAAVLSGAGLFFSQIHYNRALERYENEKRTYLDYPRLLEQSEFSYSSIEGTYATMQTAFDDADKRAKWRNVFLGAFIATYGINLLDIILSKPDTGEIQQTPPVSLEVDGGNVRLVKTFSF